METVPIPEEIKESEEEFANVFVSLFWYVVHKPTCIIRNYTIPQADKDNWNREEVAWSNVLGYLFFLFVIHGIIILD